MKIQTLVALAAVVVGAGSALAGTRVVVLPFAGTSADMKRDAWIGPAVGQNMILTLGRGSGVTAVAYAGKVTGPVDADVASRAARAMQADLAVIGSYTVVDGQVRLTAQVIDPTLGEAVGTSQVTGAAAELLALEDRLAEETRVALAAPMPAQAAVRAAPNVAPVLPAYCAYDTAYDTGYRSMYSSYSYGYGGYGAGWYVPVMNVGRACVGSGLRWSVRGSNWWISFGGGNGYGLGGGHGSGRAGVGAGSGRGGSVGGRAGPRAGR